METEQPIKDAILAKVADNAPITSSELAHDLNCSRDDVHNALKALQAIGYVQLTQKVVKIYSLSKEGKTYLELGSPEFRLLTLVKNKGGSLTFSELEQLDQNDRVLKQFGLAHAQTNGWIVANKGVITLNKDVTEDPLRNVLLRVHARELSEKDNEVALLRRRTLIEETKDVSYDVTKGPSYRFQLQECATDLTSAMLRLKKWSETPFKDYSIVKGKKLEAGNLHPLLKVRTQFRQVLLEMGFEEMPTNKFVESSFWNFDALFQPQHHPARDAHDTFYIENLPSSTIEDQAYFNRVKTMHEVGGSGSLGYRYKWSPEEALKNILRTHTTAISSQVLHKIGAEQQFRPRRLFSIDRVFRNENIDATHLAEFHQVEGLVIDHNIGLGHLKGIITEFFNRIGITDLRYKPAYNPYTEPSMEIFGYHPILKKHVEIGNSGVFRPEMLIPLGLPPDVSIIAWGLGVERPTMIQYGITNIRSLSGDEVSIKETKENPIACFK